MGKKYYIENFGPPALTDNALDFYVSGQGFFLLYDEINRINYSTRNGRFHFDGRAIMTNEDGYIVLAYDNSFITMQNFSVKNRSFVNYFMIVFPDIKSVTSMTNKYLTAAKYAFIENNRVISELIEAMPVSLDILIDAAILDIKNNKEYINNKLIIELFHKKFHEVKELYIVSEKDYAILYEKILQFEGSLLGKKNISRVPSNNYATEK